MSLLTTIQRDQIWRGLMRYWSREREPTNFLKDELRSAIDDADQWIENNQSLFVTALPTAFRDGSTGEQKTMLFEAIAAMRVSEDFARRLFGELD